MHPQTLGLQMVPGAHADGTQATQLQDGWFQTNPFEHGIATQGRQIQALLLQIVPATQACVWTQGPSVSMDS